MGVLTGVTVIELGGIGPVPFAGMLLSDLGARIIRIERKGGSLLSVPDDPTARHRERLCLNLKSDSAKVVIDKLVPKADVLIEGFRPKVLDKLGLSPTYLHKLNPSLIIGRMTGWGQTGPRANSAGHDLNYLSLSGALHAIGGASQVPPPPLNYVADYGGGALMLTVSILGALYERLQSGKGQVIDAAMCDGVASLSSIFYAMESHGLWKVERGVNLLDGGAPFYRTYKTRDNKYLAVACLEPHFYADFIRGLGIDPRSLPAQYDRPSWPHLETTLSEVIATKTRDAWTKIFEGTDACVTPVNTFAEASADPHYKARGTFTPIGKTFHPRSLPRFSRTPNRNPDSSSEHGESPHAVLLELGFSQAEIKSLVDQGVVN